MSTVFRWLEPFAASLWSCQIVELATRSEELKSRKRTHFGGLYQTVILARRR
jgi:hypothetical protein